MGQPVDAANSQARADLEISVAALGKTSAAEAVILENQFSQPRHHGQANEENNQNHPADDFHGEFLKREFK
jgi:hypothetical protein